MPSTKIINVLKSESFEDTLDLFKSTSANEVIFVLPKKAKAFSKEFHFQALAQACSDEGKIATFMSSDSEVLGLAKKYGISVLASEPRKSAKSRVVATPAFPPEILIGISCGFEIHGADLSPSESLGLRSHEMASTDDPGVRKRHQTLQPQVVWFWARLARHVRQSI